MTTTATTENLNYFIFPNDTTAALTPETRIIVSPKGVNVENTQWGGPTSWHFLPTGCVTAFTLEELLEMCMNGDDPANHNFMAVDTVVLTDDSTSVSTYKVRRTLTV